MLADNVSERNLNTNGVILSNSFMLCLKSKFFIMYFKKISGLISHQDLVFIIYLACVQSQGKLVA